MATEIGDGCFSLTVVDDGVVSCVLAAPQDGSCEEALRVFQQAVRALRQRSDDGVGYRRMGGRAKELLRFIVE